MKHSINCNNCGHEINVEEALADKITKDVLSENDSKFLQQQNALDARELALNARDKESAQQQEEEIEKRLKEKEALQLKAMKEQYEKDNKEQLDEAAENLISLNKASSSNEVLKRKLKAAESAAELNAQKKFNEDLNNERAAIQQVSDERVELLQKEHEETMAQMKKNLDAATRQANQTSMQIQGEAQEKSIENYLKEHFPLDNIESIKPGALGADCLQQVNAQDARNCGVIYYESKRTKEFSSLWIEKLKADMRAKNADIGVIATQAMPKGMDRGGLVNGVYICSLNEFKIISCLLRERLIAVSKARTIGENVGDKKTEMYRYLTSNEFAMSFEAMIEGVQGFEADRQAQKISMNKIWKRQEKNIEKMLLSASGIYGSLQGISGNSIQDIDALELDCESDDLKLEGKLIAS